MTNIPPNILIDSNVCHGKPVIQGTRTPVTVILDALVAGDSYEEIEKDYEITREEILGCIAFASSEVSSQTYVPFVVAQSH